MIFSASSPKAVFIHENSWYFVFKQSVFAGIRLIIMLIFMNLPFTIWKKSGPVLIIFSLLLLVLVLIMGTNINGAKRWFVVGGLNIQPSEFTKLSMIVYVAALEAHTDFIFAVIGEEMGLLGTALLFIVFFLFFWRGFTAAIQSMDPFGMILGMGIVSMIGIQFLLNVGAVTGSLPVTGVPLPFISYGGSSLILCMASTGILLSISREKNRRQREEQLNNKQ